MRLDQDRLVLCGLAAIAAVLVSVGSGEALASFTMAGTAQFYMPQTADSGSSSEAVADSQADTSPLEWLPSYTKVSDRSDERVDRARSDAASYD